MAERENAQPQQPESADVVRDPLTDAFLHLHEPEQIIQFFNIEAQNLMIASQYRYTPRQSLERVFSDSLPYLCLLTVFYHKHEKEWAIALHYINDAILNNTQDE